MTTALSKAMIINAYGLRAQGKRLRVIAENIANAQSTALQPGAEPYRRRVVLFRNELDRRTGVNLVSADQIKNDRRPYEIRYEPGHPAANSEGMVLYPNVNPLIEMADMREAVRSYEANLRAIETARSLLEQTIELLR